MDGEREWAPVQGVKVSDIPAGILGKRYMDGQREQAPVKWAEVSDYLITCLDVDAMDTSETVTV